MSNLKQDVLDLVNKHSNKQNKKFIPLETHVPVSGRVYDETDVSLLIESALDLLFAGNITKQPYIINNTFWIGVYPGLTKEMLDYVIDSFQSFLKGAS